MEVAISLLRGINVGGHNKIKMDSLRELYRSLGLRNPRTYVQSGNVVCGVKRSALPALAARIEAAIEGAVGFRPAVILRTLENMRNAVALNPFAGRECIEPGKLIVTFLPGIPGGDARDRLRTLPIGPEEVVIQGGELYTYFPNGMGRSKFPFAALDRALGMSGTARNWNTVTALLEMAERWTEDA